jgi:hypothetical protein
MTTPEHRDELVEQVVSAYRPRDPRGQLLPSAAFHDLDAAARIEAYEEARRARAIEAALDPEGLSSTARAVLERILRASGA